VALASATQYLKIFPRLAFLANGQKMERFQGRNLLPARLSRKAGLWMEGGSRQRRDSARRRGGGQSELCIGIFQKKGSDFVQQPPPYGI